MNLLLIDDEEDIRRIAALSLRRIGGFRVTTAATAAEGIAKACAQPPDAILLDVMMPGMDGVSAFRTIRSIDSLRDVPVVFMTARIQRSEVDQYLSLGAAGVIAKPFDPMTLAGDLERMLR